MREPALIPDVEVWRETILVKTRGLIRQRTWDNLARCGRDQIWRTCGDCGHSLEHRFRCSQKFCPGCNWSIQRHRAQQLRLWSQSISQPKHCILTRRNELAPNRELFRHTMASFHRLRRQRWFEATGGCVSMETTNEGRGWHVHLHALLNARFVDVFQLATRWGRLVGQEDHAIVFVKDVRGADYVNEVCKYVVKSSDLASWPPKEIAAFINATQGVRMFRVFGTLFHERRRIKAMLKSMRPPPEPCTVCGSRHFRFETEAQSIYREHSLLHQRRRR